MEGITAGYFFRAGGIGMVHVSIFSLIVVVAAARFALSPDERRVPFLRTMTGATLLSILCALSHNFAAVFWNVPNRPEYSASYAQFVLIGAFEALTPAVLGFALLSFAWLIKAVGMRRLAMRLP